MMLTPNVTIVIPTYNRRLLVHEAVLSALNQEHADVEVVVSDDGSTDETSDYLSSTGLPIRVIVNQHGGVGHARNAGIHAAKGEYIAFLDSDDLLLPNCTNEQVHFLNTHPNIPLVYTDQYMEFSGERFRKTRFEAEGVGDTQKMQYNLPNFIPCQAPIHTSAVMVRKSVFDEVGLFNEDLTAHGDTDMWNRISERYPLGYISKPLSVFRWGKDPEHILKPSARRQFIKEGRKYMKLYEERRKDRVIPKEEQEAIIESYSRLSRLEEIVNLSETKEITEAEYHRRRQAIFGWVEYE